MAKTKAMSLLSNEKCRYCGAKRLERAYAHYECGASECDMKGFRTTDCLYRQIAALDGENEKLRAALKSALPHIMHYATGIAEGHVCGGPDSGCDATCQMAALDALVIEQIKAALKEKLIVSI